MQPEFNWQPPAAAPMPDPLFAGNGTALWLRAGATSCDEWYPKIEEFMLLRVMQNRFLSTAVPGCGHSLGAAGALVKPVGAEAATLRRMFTQMDSLAVAVTPAVAMGAKTLRAVMHSAAAVKRFGAALAQECALQGYDGFVLTPDTSDFNASDGAALVSLMHSLAAALGPGASLGLELSGSFEAITAPLPAEVIVYVSGETASRDFAAFSAAVSAAISRFGERALSVGLSLDGASWWSGTKRPSITDVQTRLTALTLASVRQIALAVDWLDPEYLADQSRLDLVQLTMLTPFRGVAGMQWETISVRFAASSPHITAHSDSFCFGLPATSGRVGGDSRDMG